MKRMQKAIKLVALYGIVAVVVGITLLPLYWMLNTAFKPRGEILAITPHWIPEHPTLNNFKDVIKGTGMAQGGLKYAYNSI